MNTILLIAGIVLGLLFCALMVFKILPPLDHIIKKERGPLEACLLTRCCPLIIALPFYVFTIWMIVVVVFHPKQMGVSVIEEICPEDFSCANAFAFARTNKQDRGACQALNCTEEELNARSGQKPLSFPRLGLGQPVKPEYKSLNYECLSVINGTCNEVALLDEEGEESETCECVGKLSSNKSPMFCSKESGCLGDIKHNSRSSECVEGTDCKNWTVETDSAKQFSLQECYCTNDGCTQYTCDALIMDYFYPNLFLAGLTTILFIFPVVLIVYLIIKTQLSKVIPCGGFKLYVFNQEAGAQDEYRADNLATGGFNEEQQRPTKLRSFGWKDIAAIIFGPILFGFFAWIVLQVSGRVGLSFISLVFVLILLVELYNFFILTRDQNRDIERRVKQNNGNPLRAEF